VLDALERHWPAYLMEAAGLATFMISASVLTIVLEHPGSPAHRAVPSDFHRRALLGAAMGGVVAAIVYSPWGRRSGAHINPAVTWAFFRLGKIRLPDVLFYTLAQFAGATAAAVLMRVTIGEPYAHPLVNYVVTRPGPRGVAAAFGAELTITFVLMLVVLLAVGSERLERLTGVLVGALIALYIAFETPLSGMSLNPARSFGSAFAAGQWAALWLYFVAPPAGALLAAELHLRLTRGPNAARGVGPAYPVDGAPATVTAAPSPRASSTSPADGCPRRNDR